MKSLSSALTAVLVLAAPLAGIAQNNHKQLQPNEHALNLPGATTIDAPPAGFDPSRPPTRTSPITASRRVPTRPRTQGLCDWAKAMKASKTRLMPSLEQTTIFHGPAKPGKQRTPPLWKTAYRRPTAR